MVVNDGSFKVDFDNAVVSKPVEVKEVNTTCPECSALEDVHLGKYRHFKGNEYEVIGFAKHSETEEKLVLYKSVQNSDDVWARPYDMFKETVEHNGKKVNRFTPLN